LGKRDPKGSDDGLENWGLNFPLAHIWLPFVRYYRSNFIALPDVGGWFEQDDQLMRDFETLTQLVNWHIRKEGEGGSDTPPMDAWEEF
jgi:hypothetical protein